ncbi:Adenylate kinase [Amycolatopsis xylanica]|uniref:Adenylate kinase n=1 Tax=Amycolatopsis xylanica TaxID=589385 RepID=A0A1H3ADR9_9PSEU|nr:DNA topology modulation protein FlaR [Amycolatopsis xylanica]SDX27803.1 Adenylate kinase [Amycolatopsis xylanica]
MMRRVAVIGGSGSGKTTFADRLGQATGLPVTHLDELYWQPGWTQLPLPEFRARQEELVAHDRWIIDGNYSSTMDIRLPLADTVIFLDLPRRIRMRRVLVRTARRFGRTGPAPGCVERLDPEFLRWVWRWDLDSRERVTDGLREHASHARQLLVTSPREAKLLLRRLREQNGHAVR